MCGVAISSRSSLGLMMEAVAVLVDTSASAVRAVSARGWSDGVAVSEAEDAYEVEVNAARCPSRGQESSVRLKSVTACANCASSGRSDRDAMAVCVDEVLM